MDYDYEENTLNEIFSFEDEEFNSLFFEAIKKENSKEELQEILNNIPIFTFNKKRVNEFVFILNKLYPTIDAKDLSIDEIINFLNFLNESKLKHNSLKRTITYSLIIYFKNSKNIKILVKIIQTFLENSICNLKTLKEQMLENFVDKIDQKVKNLPDFESALISLFQENKFKFENFFLFSKILKGKNFSQKENSKKLISKEIINYMDDKLLDDSDPEKNLAKGRLLSPCLQYIDPTFIFEIIFPRCESLLLRTIRNYKFLEMIFTNYASAYPDQFISDLFSKFKDFFFNTDKQIVESGLCSIRKISELANKKILLKSLLSHEFSADKIEQNLNVCHYMVIILSKINTNKKFDESKENFDLEIINSDILIEIVYYSLKKLEIMNENTKPKLDLIMEILVHSLYKLSNINTDVHLQTSLSENLNNQIKKLITNSSYSFFFGYLYMLINILNEKFKIQISKNISENLFNNVKDITLNPSNMRNILPLISTCFTLAYNNEENFNSNKKSLFEALKSCLLYNKDTLSQNSILSKDYFLNMNSLDFINILNVYYQISRNQESSMYDYFYEEELPSLAKLLVHLFFRKSNKNSEENFYENFIKVLAESKNKKVFDHLINSSFLFIVNYFNNETNSINSRTSFTKIKTLIKAFIDNFYQEFDEKDFLKFMIISHIPNLCNDVNIENHKKHTNKFLQSIYKNYSKIGLNKDIYVLIDDNYNTLSTFIFSDLGIFNKNNKMLVNSCYNIITRMSESLSHRNFSANIAKDSFLNLNLDKFKYVDELIKYYSKQVDYISFYDLSYLIDNLKILEKNWNNNFVSQEFGSWGNLSQEKEVVKETPTQKVQNAKKGATQTQNKGKPNTQQKSAPVQVEKVDKETKTKELKAYLENFLINLSIGENFILNRLKPILDLFNNVELQKNNLRNILKHLWKLLKVESINSNLLQTIQKLFRENSISKNFALEFSHLMYLQVNPHLFNDMIEKLPSLVIHFNEKLEHLMSLPEERTKLFEFFDFIVIKLLFFIILNNNISNEDKVSSVNILVKIMECLPENVLNFNDISMLAASLLKTSYNDDNLSQLLEIFLKRSKEEHFLILCQDLLSYEYVAKVTFLQQISTLNLISLRKYKNLVYKIWILIFDENENISNYAKNIWNNFNLYLDTHFVQSEEFALAFTNHKLRDSINRSISAYSYIVKSEVKTILNKFEKFYELEINTSLDPQEEEQENSNHYQHGDKKHLRTILLDYVDETIELFSSEMKQSLLDFLMNVSDKESDEEIFQMMNKTIFNIISSIKEENIIQKILASIEKNIKQISTKNIKEINYNNLKIILMMLNSILMNSQGNKGEKASLYDSIILLATRLTNSEVLCLISSCYQYLAKNDIAKSELLMSQILERFSNTKDKLMNIGDIYILSGLIKCFGINSYKSKKIDQVVLENMKKNKSIYEKQNAMILIKVFAETMKRLYEPYLVSLFDQICELIADREDKVRECTQAAIKSFMKEISGYGVKSIMPRLIKDLHSMNWKSKVVNIEILGQFAFCAPKQLSIYIPKVIKEIMQVFKDPHQKVQETAVMVLKDISSVIKNPEIVDLSDMLIDAISNPYEHSKNALTALLQTDFKHAIDPPSLALIIPIIDYNLKVQNENLKKMAAHLIGSIANLISNPLDIYQYIDIIIPNLKVALFDSIPECRNAMAKAIGSLTKSLGMSYLQEMISWVKTFLETESDTVQKSGAAQAYAEMLVAFGEGFIDKHILHIISKVQESDHISKEGYLSIFVFLPGCLQERFEKYFELIFPLIIEGFSDEHENVRNVSNKIFEICIKLFAKRNTKQLVDPLLLRLFDSNWRIRNSSIALIKTLIMNLNKEFFKESSTFFTKEQRDEILVLTFILKADNSGNTATIANMIWRDYVDNIPKYLSKVLKQIYEQLMVLLSTDNDECFDIAEGCIKMLVTKFSDKFFMELLPAIKDTITERKDSENIVYASFYIFQLAVTESSEKLLSGYKERFIKIVNDNVHTSFSSVRKLLASIIYEISRKFDDHNMNKSFIYNIMKGARGKVYEEQKNLLEIVGNLVDISKGEVLHYVINEIFRKPFEEGFISLASMISDDIADGINHPTELKDLYGHLCDSLLYCPTVAIDAIVNITVRVEEKYLPVFAEVISKLQDKLELTAINDLNKNMPMNLSLIISKFTDLSQQDLSHIDAKLMEMNIGLLNFDDDLLIKNIGESVKIIIEKTEKEEMDKFVKAFLFKLTELEDKYHLQSGEELAMEKISHKFKLMMDSLLYLVQNGLLYSEDKLLACDYIHKVLFYTTRTTMKTYIMKMIGPMIRILSEKFSPEIKERVLDNIKTLIVKSREDVKGISPQLQSVFVKTLTDTSQVNTERCQLKSGENILRLLQFYPRADVIVNDLIKSIIAKFEKNEFLLTIVETEILSDIVRFYGHTLKPNLLTENYQKVLSILNSRPDVPYDYLVTLLSSFTKHHTDPSICQKICEETLIKEDLPKKLFNFLNIFNGNLAYFNFNNNKKNAIKIIKSLPKDQSVILLKTLGKIINKYRYFIDFDKTNFENLLSEYERVVQIIIAESDLFTASNNILDGNLCVFILSLGYMQEYEANEKLFNKIFSFLLGLISQGKVNSQLLVNCLSLLVLREIRQNPERESIIANLENIGIEESDIEIVDAFLKKIYYLYN